MATIEGRRQRNNAGVVPPATETGKHTVPVTRIPVDPAAGRKRETDGARTGPAAYAWALARIALGWVFLWAFLDKTFGWGFATPADRAWVQGGSPTTGFLKGTADNALGGFFGGLAGQGWVDLLFMLGLLGVGGALIVGAGMRIAAVAGGLMMVLMWAAALPLVTNPSWTSTSLRDRAGRSGHGERRRHPGHRRPVGPDRPGQAAPDPQVDTVGTEAPALHLRGAGASLWRPRGANGKLLA